MTNSFEIIKDDKENDKMMAAETLRKEKEKVAKMRITTRGHF